MLMSASRYYRPTPHIHYDSLGSQKPFNELVSSHPDPLHDAQNLKSRDVVAVSDVSFI